MSVKQLIFMTCFPRVTALWDSGEQYRKIKKGCVLFKYSERVTIKPIPGTVLNTCFSAKAGYFSRMLRQAVEVPGLSHFNAKEL